MTDKADKIKFSMNTIVGAEDVTFFMSYGDETYNVGWTLDSIDTLEKMRNIVQISISGLLSRFNANEL